MIDKALILRKFSELDEYSRQIGEFASTTSEEYSGNWKIQRIVERTLQMMIESCADIANHIISSNEYRVPKNYVDIFKVLYENDIIDSKTFDNMANMVKFRNIVVHDDDKIDASIVINILRKQLNDFMTFRNAILHVL
ncbi:hypothetical protein SCALIN_C04_0264 [Candidatus Scalindua japonica]|uniref:DUF86 domain-containing protein n=1 Tax=Candidatus Scalindua japonica TaxID=1284222 RepID=A0A286TV79_9BACT|nr:DUF86 domain-containing protein [Candidatus Scalindua japonica]GAX59776.1 hypothetical protein SCALIN_C04_0264 [Candidatus Scalindua japonica]